jgi:Mce-associated membrane protein
VIDDARDVEDTQATKPVEVDSARPETPTVRPETPTVPTEPDYSVLETFEVTSPLAEPPSDVDESVTEEVEVGADGPSAPAKRRRLRLPGLPGLPNMLRLPHLPGLPQTRFDAKVVSVILVVLLVVTGSAASWVYFKQYRPDQQTDAGVSRAALSAATEGTEAVLSYSSDTLDQDFAAARSHLGGDFLSYYKQFTAQVIAPAAKLKSLKTTAHVASAAVSELHPNSAVVLVFVDQTTSIKDNPLPSLAASSILLNMTRVNGTWLITKFTPM